MEDHEHRSPLIRRDSNNSRSASPQHHRSDDENRGRADRDKDEKSHSRSRSRSRSSSKSHSHSKSPLREKYGCCSTCIKGVKPGRSCICLVPSETRRGTLSSDGCINCNCLGCHPDDVENTREKEKERKENGHLSSRKGDRIGEEPLKNGCCKNCMKAFNDSKRACLCQVPINVRIGVLPETGCRLCGCFGCHPDEINMRRRPFRMPAGGLPFYPPPPPAIHHHDHRRDRRGYRESALLPYPTSLPPGYLTHIEPFHHELPRRSRDDRRDYRDDSRRDEYNRRDDRRERYADHRVYAPAFPIYAAPIAHYDRDDVLGKRDRDYYRSDDRNRDRDRDSPKRSRNRQ
eukprot:TRINITY_DN7246_c0_g1_i1.p1 TRINITY_DN7246_c0_g1~~TRINITY_DN7246_c0_g1_i1.p1  ORF type:complete len:345 (-),score=23.56 TRINITY_DN7246_c0_g1_i1:555-1589(-)